MSIARQLNQRHVVSRFCEAPGLIFSFTVSGVWLHSICGCLFVLGVSFILVWFVLRLMVRRHRTTYQARLHEQLVKHARIARDLNDNLLQTIEASKMIADDALDAPADPVRMGRAMGRLSDWLGEATKDGRAALDSLRTATSEESNPTTGPLPVLLEKLWRSLWHR